MKMTRKEQVKILNSKIEANKRKYDLDRINAEISAYSSGDLPKYEYLTKKDLGYKPDALEIVKFEYSPLGKVFTDGLDKSDEKVGIFQRVKNIEGNLNSNDDDNGNDNGKVGIFQIIKDIKDKGIKISIDDETIREIREHIQNLRNKGIRVNNFDEISREIRDHIQNLKDEGIDVNINNDQVKDLVNKILKGISKRDSTLKDSASKDSVSEDSVSEDSDSEDSDSEDSILKRSNIKKFLLIYKEPIITFYKDSDVKYNMDTKKIDETLREYKDKNISRNKFLQTYNIFIDKFDRFSKIIIKKSNQVLGVLIKKNY